MGKLRWSAWILGISNVLVIILGIVLMGMAPSSCKKHEISPFFVVALVSCVRVGSMIHIARIQEAVAKSVVESQSEPNLHDASIRNERRRRYKRWLWGTRFTTLITLLQCMDAFYLVIHVTETMYESTPSCVIGLTSSGTKLQHYVLIILIGIVCYVPFVQCFAGSDVLRWRSFYSSDEKIWKAHYQEVFDHGIREAFCCLGRVKYLTVLEEDEVYAVATLLGDLVTYRASGTGHLELLAGLALLQKSNPSPNLVEEVSRVPEEKMQEAVMLHPFAEAAYTGLLLDLGRNPVLFPFTWLYRQGVFTPWSRNRLPILQGDNLWRGHAAAFLNFVNLKPEVLRKGRVNQGKCRAAYFIVVLHHLKSVVIAVRGTETPEDLITDGLCRECDFKSEDIDGLISYDDVQAGKSESLLSSSSHYGHSGVIEAARDLYTQVEGDSKNGGYLSKLLGTGCECDGYNVRIVGHSLGGAIAALLGMRLRRPFPKLHVYAYGPLPCVDLDVASACSEFITSIVYDNEFSSRLSIASILRLQAAAIKALSDDTQSDSTTLLRLARHFLYTTYCHQNQDCDNVSIADIEKMAVTAKDKEGNIHCFPHDNGNGVATGIQDPEENPLWLEMVNYNCSSGHSSATIRPIDDLTPPIITEVVPSCDCIVPRNIPEMYLPGMIIHIVPEHDSECVPLWKRWTSDKGCCHRAYVVKREAFKDIVVSPYMFLDHLPWRCYSAITKVIDISNFQSPQDVAQIV